MPIYEFVNEEHGIRAEARFPVSARPDTIVLTRRTVPSRLNIGVGAQPMTAGQELLADYKKLEATTGLDQRPGRMTAEQIKAAAQSPAAANRAIEE